MPSNNRRRSNRNNSQCRESEKKVNRVNLPTCSICGKTIRNLNTAIADKKDGKPAHFDCVLAYLSLNESLGNHEKICYLGNGSFGIVRQKPGNGKRNFFIRKRIQYENNELDLEWRKKISSRYINKI